MQLKLASFGVKARVEELRTQTGVSDTIAEYWFPQLLERSQSEQKIRITNKQTRDPRLSDGSPLSVDEKNNVRQSLKEEISREVLEWLYSQPEHSFSKLPPDSRKSLGMTSTLYIDGLTVYMLIVAERHRFRAGDHYNSLLDADGRHIFT